MLVRSRRRSMAVSLAVATCWFAACKRTEVMHPGPSSSALASASAAAELGRLSARSTVDRPDDSSEPQVHVLYVIAHDGHDNQLDVNGSIRASVASAQEWFIAKSGGLTPRFDTASGVLDVTFLRLIRNEADMRTYGNHILVALNQGLARFGFTSPNKLYVMYYDGIVDGEEDACGLGLDGHAVVLLRACPRKLVADSFAEQAPTTWEIPFVHEIVHALGGVARCAPHFEGAHVSDDPNDLMVTGRMRNAERTLEQTVLDKDRDDYFRHSIPGCFDLAKSPFIVPADPSVLLAAEPR